MSSRPSLLVVIVNYRTPALVVECLRSLEPEIRAHSNAKVMVVDNASGDGSVDIIATAISRQGWSHWATAQASPVNGGFAYGNNYAIESALKSSEPPENFWLLNPDTVVRPGAMLALADFLMQHPTAGICGGGIDEPDGKPWPFAFRFPNVLSEIERGFNFGPVTRLLRPWMVRQEMGEKPARVDWVCGASMMVRRKVIEAIGLMDQEYFLYFEETDYCLQAGRAGIECWYVPQSRVIHIAGQSTGVTAKVDKPRRLPRYWFDSRRRYFIKNHGRIYAVTADIVWMIAFVLGRLRRWLQLKPNDAPPHYLTDFFRNSALLQSSINGGVVREQART